MSDHTPDENGGKGSRDYYGQFPVTGEELLAHVIRRKIGEGAPRDVSAEARAELLGFTHGLLAFGHIRRETADTLLEPLFGPSYISSHTVTRRIEG